MGWYLRVDGCNVLMPGLMGNHWGDLEGNAGSVFPVAFISPDVQISAASLNTGDDFFFFLLHLLCLLNVNIIGLGVKCSL